jgi:hypothetical protein
MERKGSPKPRRWFATLVAVVLLSVGGLAHAASVGDPNTALGPLDLKRLSGTKHDATAPLEIRVVTYGSWPASLLDVSGESRLFILFNTDRSGRFDFKGEIFYRDGRLVMRLRTRDGQFVRRIGVRHPTQDTIRTRIPRGLPNPDGNVWIAAEERYVTETGGCASGCDDRIPGKGWLKITPGQ